VTENMRIRLDRTLCDGFGICAGTHPAISHLMTGVRVADRRRHCPQQDRDAVLRALLDCPVHAIMELNERPQDVVPPHPATDEDPGAHLKTAASEAEWGFTR